MRSFWFLVHRVDVEGRELASSGYCILIYTQVSFNCTSCVLGEVQIFYTARGWLIFHGLSFTAIDLVYRVFLIFAGLACVRCELSAEKSAVHKPPVLSSLEVHTSVAVRLRFIEL